MPLSPLQRKAAFAHAITMRETTKTAAAMSLGYSLTHIEATMSGERVASDELKAKLAEYCAHTEEAFWGEPVSVARAS